MKIYKNLIISNLLVVVFKFVVFSILWLVYNENTIISSYIFLTEMLFIDIFVIPITLGIINQKHRNHTFHYSKSKNIIIIWLFSYFSIFAGWIFKAGSLKFVDSEELPLFGALLGTLAFINMIVCVFISSPSKDKYIRY